MSSKFRVTFIFEKSLEEFKTDFMKESKKITKELRRNLLNGYKRMIENEKSSFNNANKTIN